MNNSFHQIEQAGFSTLLNGLVTLPNIDIAFGVGNYTDFLDKTAPAFTHKQSLIVVKDQDAPEAQAIKNAINGWKTAGGGQDSAECQLYALDQLAQPPWRVHWLA